MRYNTHCHVFNLQSIFNDATAFILENRLQQDHGLSANLAAGIVAKLKQFMAHGGGFDSVDDDPRHFEPTWPSGLLGQAREFWEALHLAMLKNMDQVTDDMVAQLATPADDVVFTPMMMDILVAPQQGVKAGDVFDDQVKGTQRQIARYPGHILPFYAVNPFRWDFVHRTIKALEQGGFVGVKLYPSLGYDIYASGMDGVMHYCDTHRIPVLMHCNDGGFKQSNATVPNCAPNLWGAPGNPKGYLATYPNLKICFAHFGGDGNFTGQAVVSQASWTKDILSLMLAYPGRVFADVAYHQAALDPATSAAYFQGLNAILKDPGYVTQVLWGTDTWLVRMVCKELAYWSAFWPGPMDQDAFERISQANSRAFLGIDAASPGQNIRNYMAYMQANAGWTQAQAQAWLQNAAT